MGEWTYLSVEARDGSTRELLTAKRHFPFAWALAFEAIERAPTAGKLSAPFDDAVGRLRRRVNTLAKRGGPKLTAVLDGFVEFVAAQGGARLIYDASEIATAYGSANELVELTELAAKLDERKPILARDDLAEWGIDDGDDRPDYLELDDVYLFFGTSIGGGLAWLRPPNIKAAR